MTRLLVKFKDTSAHVVVIGIGYVGLPLVAELSRRGFRVTGYDKDEAKVHCLSKGRSYIADVADEPLLSAVEAGRLRATTDPSVIGQADAVIVCVPTPLNKTREPDMRFILEATEAIATHQHDDMLIVLESTTYPGTTSEVLVPRLTSETRKIGAQVFVAFSPERVDPGNQRYQTHNTPKVIGGTTPRCLEIATALYSQIIEELVPVSSTETAEMVKLLENTFRAVNIGLVNEVAMMARRLGIDPFEVIRAAATKPFGYMPFYPGPGLGGHCIPIDPLYLSWKLKSLSFEARFIALADSINSNMPSYVCQRVADALNDHEKSLRKSHVLIYGMAYKPDVSDVRESPALGVAHELLKRGAIVDYMDPFVSSVDEEGLALRATPPEAGFDTYDVIVITTHHSALPAERMLREAKLIVDTRGALRPNETERDRVYGL